MPRVLSHGLSYWADSSPHPRPRSVARPNCQCQAVCCPWNESASFPWPLNRYELWTACRASEQVPPVPSWGRPVARVTSRPPHGAPQAARLSRTIRHRRYASLAQLFPHAPVHSRASRVPRIAATATSIEPVATRCRKALTPTHPEARTPEVRILAAGLSGQAGEKSQLSHRGAACD